MRKSVLIPAVAAVGGIVGLLVRRVYLVRGFEAGTGLPIPGAPSFWAMLLVGLALAVVLALLCRGKHRRFDRCYAAAFYPETSRNTVCQLAGGVLIAIGGFLALFHWVQSPADPLTGQRSASLSWLFLGILSLLAGAAVYFLVLKMRRGQPIQTAWATLPGFAGCLWLMANYYAGWAGNPILGQFLVPMLAVMASTVACWLMAAFAFDKSKVGYTLFAAALAGCLNLMSLADTMASTDGFLALSDTALYLGMAFYLLASGAALAYHDAQPETAPPCTAGCEGCPGCAPMGTLPQPESKAKKSAQGNAHRA